jgi:hypothetical protein
VGKDARLTSCASPREARGGKPRGAGNSSHAHRQSLQHTQCRAADTRVRCARTGLAREEPPPPPPLRGPATQPTQRISQPDACYATVTGARARNRRFWAITRPARAHTALPRKPDAATGNVEGGSPPPGRARTAWQRAWPWSGCDWGSTSTGGARRGGDACQTTRGTPRGKPATPSRHGGKQTRRGGSFGARHTVAQWRRGAATARAPLRGWGDEPFSSSAGRQVQSPEGRGQRGQGSVIRRRWSAGSCAAWAHRMGRARLRTLNGDAWHAWHAASNTRHVSRVMCRVLRDM